MSLAQIIPDGKVLLVIVMTTGFSVLSAACITMSADTPWLLFVPLLSLVGIIAAGITILAMAGSMSATIAVLAIIVFLTNGSFRVRGSDDAALDWQGVLKFAVWIGSGLVGSAHLFIIPNRKPINKVGAVLWLTYLCFALLSAFYAPAPIFSFGYAIALLCLFTFMYTLIGHMSEAAMLWTITLVLAAFLIVSWVVYFGDPELGRFQDKTESGYEIRMSGIAGQANSLGSISAIYLAAVFLLWWQRQCWLPWALSLALLGLTTLAATDSRTGLICLAAGVVAVIFTRSTWSLLGFGLVAAGGLGALISKPHLVSKLVGLFSRSGDPTEALTLTGRTQIWEFSWQKILESPWIGWGYNSSKIILAQHLGFANGLMVDQAHNLLLQNLLSVGLVGSVPLCGLFVKLIVDVIRGKPAPVAVLFLVMVFVNGISDPSAVGAAPTVLTLVFMLASLWPSSDVVMRHGP